MNLKAWTVSTLVLSSLTLVAYGAQSSYSLLKRLPLEGEGGWDYLTIDSATQRLYISRGTMVQVMDVNTGRLIGVIGGTNGVHGIALAPKLGQGFTSDGRDNKVTVFELDSLKEIAKVKVGSNPDAILYDAATNRVLTFNGQSSDASILDASTHTLLGTVKLHGKPEFPCADGKGMVFVNIEDTSEIQQIDVKKLSVVKTWSIAPGEEPSGMAIDLKDHLLFSVCGNQKMAISDFVAGKLVTTTAIGNGPDAAAYDAKAKLAFSSNGQDGTLSVVAKSATGFGCIQTVTTQKGARTMALDPKTHRIYLITAEFDAPAPGSRRGRMKPGSAVILVVGPK